MQASDFSKDKPGQLIKTIAGQSSWAFVPNPLPPEIPYTWKMGQLISEADLAIGRLSGAAINLNEGHFLTKLFLRREAIISSRIEGIDVSMLDLLSFETLGLHRSQAAQISQVLNYVKAVETGRDCLKYFPISLRLIKEVHSQLMRGVKSKAMKPGEFRRFQNWICKAGCSIQDAVYVPPPPQEMQQALNHLETFIHADSTFLPLVRLALIHYQFEAIHPFTDGNGRVGRILIPLILYSEGILPQPFLDLSAFFERNKKDYYSLLLSVSQTGDWNGWIEFFLRGITEQSEDSLERLTQLVSLRESYYRRVHAAPAVSLIDSLFSSPVTTISQASRDTGVSYYTAGISIDKLVNAGILHEITGQQRNKVFIAPEILNII